jgi:hypothetical protein
VAVSALAAAAALSIDAARRETPTIDEFAHLPAGLAAWGRGDHGVYGESPPLGRLWMTLPALVARPAIPATAGVPSGDWAPWLYGEEFYAANRADHLRLFALARLGVIAVWLAGGWLLFHWAERRDGPAAALVALVLYLSCPNLTAYGRLATVDAAFTTCLILAGLAFEAWRSKPSRGRLVLFSLASGALFLHKLTAVAIVPVLWALVAVVTLRREGWARGLPRAGRRLVLAAAVALAVIHAGYRFREPFRPLGGFDWRSEAGRALSAALPSWLPVPLPAAFVRGVDGLQHDAERGEFGTYFAGRWSARPPLAVTPALLALKVPVATLLLVAAAAIVAIRRPRSADLVVWVVPAVILLALTGTSALQPAMRYLIPALPFLYLGVARLAGGLEARSLRGVALALACAALVIEAGLTHPHQLAYFNALAGGRQGGHRWFIDSNLDWGQDLWRVRPFMETNGLSSVNLLYFGHVHPEAYGIDYSLPPDAPAPGIHVVSVSFAQGHPYIAVDHGRWVWVPKGAPEWLRARRPDEVIGASLWVYRVP